jgi:hypothetical protein
VGAHPRHGRRDPRVHARERGRAQDQGPRGVALIHEELLGTLAEVAVAFAGFAGLASLFGERADAPRRAFDVFDRVAMIGFGVQAAAFALLPRIVAALGATEPLAWRLCGFLMAAALLGWSLYGASRRRRIARAVGASAREARDWLPRAGVAISVVLLVLFVLRPAERIAGIYVTTLFGMLAFSSAYFLRMLIPAGR